MSNSSEYVPPKVWIWDKESGGNFANMNRPIAGAIHEADLPVGKHPLQLYSLGTPNGIKVTILLEELLSLGYEGAEYDAFLINIGKQEQFSSGFVEVNPNSKIPALLDTSVDPSIRIFESGAILVYLAEKFGKWEARPILEGVLVISMLMLLIKMNMQSIDLPWKLNVN
jgi:GST-like protein